MNNSALIINLIGTLAAVLLALAALYTALRGPRQAPAEASSSTATAAAEISEGTIHILGPLNDQIAVLRAKLDQQGTQLLNNATEISNLTQVRESQEARLLDAGRQIDGLAQRASDQQATLDSQQAELGIAHNEIVALTARLTVSEATARGLKHGVQVLIAQLERVGIPPEYRPSND